MRGKVSSMARGLQVFSFFYRLCATSVNTSVTLNNCRIASRRSNKTWMDQSHDVHKASTNITRYKEETSDEEHGFEDVEDKLQALLDEGRMRQKTVKFHILRRHMTPSGAPQRKLTWDAIEQIRYLKQEQPEEWTVKRLAEGFSVTPDVISRVLRSKFTPSLNRKGKQDAKVMAAVGQQVLLTGAGGQQDKLKLPGNRTPALLTSGNNEDALVSLAGHTQMIQGSQLKSPVPVTVLTPRLTRELGKDGTLMRSTADERNDNSNQLTEDEELEERWDGQVLTEEELEEFLDMDKPPVVQVGNDFFDEEGNFIYRI